MTSSRSQVRIDANRIQLVFATLICGMISGLFALFSTALVTAAIKSHIDVALLAAGLMCGAIVALFLMGTVRNAKEAIHPGWITVSANQIDIHRLGETKFFRWADISEPKLRYAKGKPIGCQFTVLATNRLISIFSDKYKTSPELLLGFLESARAGQPVELQHVVVELRDASRWPSKLSTAIAFWAALWVLLIGGIGAMYVVGNIRDAHLRADLARQGKIASATISGYGSPIYTDKGGCGKGGGAVVRFNAAGKVYTECVREDGLAGIYASYVGIAPPPEAKVDVAYERDDPPYFVVAPNGTVPQRDINGVWSVWALQTLILLAIFIPITSLVLYWQWRRKRT